MAESLQSPVDGVDSNALELVDRASAAAAKGELLVILDFDRTLTSNFMPDGQRVTSAHGILEVASVLSETFKSKAHELFRKYYPIEIDEKMPIDEKVPIMHKWYGQVHELIMKENVTKDNIAGAVSSCKTIRLRDGMLDFLQSCQSHDPVIPVIIMSAGLGDVIEEFLRQVLPFPLQQSTHVVSNRMVFDESGRLSDFSEPLLHMFNKTAAFFPEATKKLAEGKEFCLLMGDGVGDCTMADGLEIETLKVGFLNEKVEERLPEFRRKFDIVVTDDGVVPEAAFRAIHSA